MSRPITIFDEFTNLPISNQSKYERRKLAENPEAHRAKRRAKQSTPEYKAHRRIYMKNYYAREGR